MSPFDGFFMNPAFLSHKVLARCDLCVMQMERRLLRLRVRTNTSFFYSLQYFNFFSHKLLKGSWMEMKSLGLVATEPPISCILVLQKQKPATQVREIRGCAFK